MTRRRGVGKAGIDRGSKTISRPESRSAPQPYGQKIRELNDPVAAGYRGRHRAARFILRGITSRRYPAARSASKMRVARGVLTLAARPARGGAAEAAGSAAEVSARCPSPSPTATARPTIANRAAGHWRRVLLE